MALTVPKASQSAAFVATDHFCALHRSGASERRTMSMILLFMGVYRECIRYGDLPFTV